MRKAFVVSLEMPSGCSTKDMIEYIKDSVRSMNGSKDPADPIFHLERDSVKVTLRVERKS